MNQSKTSRRKEEEKRKREVKSVIFDDISLILFQKKSRLEVKSRFRLSLWTNYFAKRKQNHEFITSPLRRSFISHRFLFYNFDSFSHVDYSQRENNEPIQQGE
jgi:hypothetical protein